MPTHDHHILGHFQGAGEKGRTSEAGGKQDNIASREVKGQKGPSLSNATARSAQMELRTEYHLGGDQEQRNGEAAKHKISSKIQMCV